MFAIAIKLIFIGFKLSILENFSKNFGKFGVSIYKILDYKTTTKEYLEIRK